MKKLIITALSILTVFGLSACGNVQTSDKNVETGASTTTSASAVTTVTTSSATTSVGDVVTTAPTSTSEGDPIVTTSATTSTATEVEKTTTTKSTTTTVATKKPTTTTTTKKATTTTAKKTTTTAKKTTTTAPVTSKKEVRTNHAGTVIPDGVKWIFTQEDIDSLVEYAKYYATEVKGLKWDDTLTRENSSWAGDSGFYEYNIFFDMTRAKESIKEDIDYWADKNYWIEGECYIDTIGLEIVKSFDSNRKYPSNVWDFYFLR